jgi:hypothetical protein
MFKISLINKMLVCAERQIGKLTAHRNSGASSHSPAIFKPIFKDPSHRDRAGGPSRALVMATWRTLLRAGLRCLTGL